MKSANPVSTIKRRTALDVEAIRRDFPILQRKVNGRPLVYLDSAATSQKPEVVIRAMDHYYRWYNANIHRGIHKLSEESTTAYEEARAKVARFIGARSARECIFVRNTTEGINLVAYAWGRKHIGPGDEILLTEMEHHSNLVPWQRLAEEKGARLRFLPVTDDGYLDLSRLDDLLTERTRLVAIIHMSNVLGTINPVEEIIRAAHEHGTLVLVDGAQSVPHFPVDVQKLDCDFLAFSGHKMCGPTGSGVLYGKRHLLEEMDPFMGGGDMIKEVHLYESRWNDVPWKFEAGTPSIVEGIALGVAVDYLTGIGMEAIHEHEQHLTHYGLERLGSVKGVTIYGPRSAEEKGGVITFNVEGIHPHDLATMLDAAGVAIRAGHHCAMPLHERYGIPASARASFYLYTTFEEIDALVDALEQAKAVFGV
jgi:cysteine desulfurase/selenocysteine lyase